MESETSRLKQLGISILRISDKLKENRVNGLAEYFKIRETSTNFTRLSAEARTEIHAELLTIDLIIMVRAVKY